MQKGIYDLRHMNNIKTGWEIFGSKRGKIEPEDRVRQGKGLKGFVHNATPVYEDASEQLDSEFHPSTWTQSERERRQKEAGSGEINLEESAKDSDPPGVSALRRIKEHLDKVGFVGTGAGSDLGENLESNTSIEEKRQ